MRNIPHILALIFLWINLSFGQTLDKKYIDDWVLNTFPSSQIGENAKNGLITIVTDDKNIFGNYTNIAKIKTGQSFTTKLTLNSDSTFEYSFKGDMYYDEAIGTYKVLDNKIILSYITSIYNTDALTRNKIINNLPPTNVSVDEMLTWKKHTADFWPLELRIKKNKLIVIKTNEDNEPNNKMILRKLNE